MVGNPHAHVGVRLLAIEELLIARQQPIHQGQLLIAHHVGVGHRICNPSCCLLFPHSLERVEESALEKFQVPLLQAELLHVVEPLKLLQGPRFSAPGPEAAELEEPPGEAQHVGTIQRGVQELPSLPREREAPAAPLGALLRNTTS